jgi:multiple sugar transport system ATP-binding protein
MADLRISGLHKSYGAVKVVRGIDLDIADGEFTVFVGPSGCGKSTLLRTIAGLEMPDAGSIRIGGRDVTDMRPRDRDIAMVFQNYALYPYLTVYENVAFGLRARKTPERELDARVREAAAMLGIEPLLERYPRQLSGGQRQRVAIGRAVVRKAKLFLFDEPLSNLDAQLRDEMRGEIKRLHAALGTTMIYVTHDQVEAMTLADRIVLLKAGQIEQQGAPLDLFDRPRSRFVASFLGSPSMNFLPARLEAGSTGPCLRLASGDAVDLLPETAARLSRMSSPDLLVGIRPEHFSRVEGSALQNGFARLHAIVQLLQPTGTRTFATVSLGGGSVVAELPAHEVRREGEAISLAVDTKRLVFIEPSSGLAL